MYSVLTPYIFSIVLFTWGRIIPKDLRAVYPSDGLYKVLRVGTCLFLVYIENFCIDAISFYHMWKWIFSFMNIFRLIFKSWREQTFQFNYVWFHCINQRLWRTKIYGDISWVLKRNIWIEKKSLFRQVELYMRYIFRCSILIYVLFNRSYSNIKYAHSIFWLS